MRGQQSWAVSSRSALGLDCEVDPGSYFLENRKI